MSGHRWSGWPGAWCLDCGVGCVMESAICCDACYVPCCPEDEANDPVVRLCAEHQRIDDITAVCPEPWSRRCDPYAQRSVVVPPAGAET